MSRLFSLSALATFIILLIGSPDVRAQQYWDGVTASPTGTWTATSTNWTNGTGMVDTSWGNGSGFSLASAVFGIATATGTYTVTVNVKNGPQLYTPGLIFNAGGYNLIPQSGDLNPGLGLMASTGTSVVSINTAQGSTTIKTLLSSVDGTTTLSKDGAGQLIFASAQNSGNGNFGHALDHGLVLNQGSIVAATAGALGTTTSTVTLNGSAGLQNYLQLSGSSSTPINYGNDLVINGTVLIVSDNGVAAAGTTKTFGALNLNGVLYSQNNQFTSSGASTLSFASVALSGANAAVLSQNLGSGTGSNLVNLGSVIGTTTNFVVGGGAATTITGTVDLGSGNLVKLGSGVLTLVGSVTTSGSINITQDSGGTVILGGSETSTSILVQGGKLQLGTSTTGITNFITNTATVTLSGGNFSVAQLAAGATQQEVIGTLVIGVGTNQLTSTAGGTANQTFVLNNPLVRTAGGLLDIGVTTSTSNGAVSFATAQTGTINGIIGGWATTGDDFAGITTSGTFIGAISGSNTTTGTYTFYTSDFSAATSTQNVRLTMTAGTTVFLGGDTTVNSLNFSSTGTGSNTIFDLSGHTLDLGTGGLQGHASTPYYEIVDGYITAGTSNADAEVDYTANSTQKLELGAVIKDNSNGGVVSLVIGGIGSLQVILSGINIYTGSTYLEDGITYIMNDHALGAAPTPGSSTANNVVLSNNAILEFNDFAPVVFSSSRGITVTGGGGNIKLQDYNGGFAFSNSISGTGPVGFTGTGSSTKFIISGASTYDGVTTLGVSAGGNVNYYFTSIGNIGGGASSFGAPTTAANGVVNFLGNSPTLIYDGVGVSTTDREFRFNSTGGANFAVNGATALTLNGNILNLGTSATLTFSGYGLANFNGNILQTETAATNVTFGGSGGGIWRLTGESTYTGVTTVYNGGVVEFTTVGNIGAGPSSLGAPATAAAGIIALGVANKTGATLRFVGSASQSTDRVLNVVSASRLETTGTGYITFLNGAALGNALALGGTSNGFFSGAGILRGANSLTMSGLTGQGVWTLNQSIANTYGGGTIISAGTLVLDYRNLTAGPANLILSTGAVTLSGGILKLVGKAAGTTATTQSTGNVTMTANTGSVLNLAAGGSNALTLSTGTWTHNTAATLMLQESGASTLSFTGGLTDTGTTNIVDYIFVNGTDFGTVSGTTVVALGIDGYTALPTTTGSDTGVYMATASQTETLSTDAYGLKIAPTSAGTLTLSGTSNLGAGSHDFSIVYDGDATSSPYTIQSTGTGAIGSGSDVLYISTTGTSVLTIASQIFASTTETTGLFVKTGTGTLILSGNNTYYDSSSIEFGTLMSGSDTGFSKSSVYTLGASAVLATNGFNPGVLYLAGTGTVMDGASANSIFTIGANNTNSGSGFNGGANASATQFTGIIEDGGAGSLTVVKSGYGAEYFNNQYNAMNTYSGATTVTSGILAVSMVADKGVASSIGTGNTDSSINLGSYGQLATLQFQDTVTANQETNRPIILAAGGTEAFDVVGMAGVLGANGYTTGNGDMFGALVTLNGTISGGGTLLKLGVGNLDLRGLGIYSGGTVVDQGILRFGTTASVPQSGMITVNYGGTVGTGFAMDSSFLSKISTDSTGVVALGADTSANLDFSNLPDVALGALGHFTYSGATLKANAVSGYQLGGGGFNSVMGAPGIGPMSVLAISGSNVITGANNVTISPHGTAGAAVIFEDAQNFTGTLTVAGDINQSQVSANMFPNGSNGWNSSTPTWMAFSELDLEGGSLMGVSAINLNPLGALKVYATASPVNRISDSAPIIFNGGDLAFLNDNTGASGFTDTNTSFSETFGAMTLNRGYSEVYTTPAGTGQTSSITFASLNRQAGATVLFAGTGLGTSKANMVNFTTDPGFSNTVATPWAFYASGGNTLSEGDAATDFAIISNTGTVGSAGSVRAANGHALTSSDSLGTDGTVVLTRNWSDSELAAGGDYTLTTTVTTSGTTDPMNPTGAATLFLTTSRSINTLRLIANGNGSGLITTGSVTGLTLAVNGILNGVVNSSGTSNLTIGLATDAPLTLTSAATGTAASEIVFNSSAGLNAASNIIVNANIKNTASGSSVAVVKTGISNLTLCGTDTYTGGTVIDGIGELIATNVNALGSGAITLNSGSLGFSALGSGATIANNIVVNSDAVIQDGNSDTDFNLAGSITLNGGTLYYIDNQNVSDHTLSGAISGSGNIAFQGNGGGTTGIISLSGTSANTMTGTTIIEGREDGATQTIVSLDKSNTNGNVNAIGGNILLGISTAASNNGNTQQQEILEIGGLVTTGLSTDQIADTSVITFQGGNGYDAGVFQLNGHNETIGGLQSSTMGDGLVQNNAEAAGTSLLTLNPAAGATNTFSGLIQDHDNSATTAAGKLEVTISGTGTQVFSNNNTYSGGTMVHAGTLAVANTGGSATGSGAFSVDAGGVLTGTGTIISSGTSISGNVMAGTGGLASTGKLTLLSSGGTKFLSGANLTFNLDASIPSQSNSIDFGSSSGISFGATGTSLTFNIVDGAALTGGTDYTLFFATNNTRYADLVVDGNGHITNFNIVFNGAGNQLAYQDSYLFLSGGNIEIAVVPEPGTWALMLGGLALLLVYQRSRCSKNS